MSDRIEEIRREEADAALGALYDDLRATLGVGWVAYACRVLATFDGWLPAAWAGVRPALSVPAAREAADAVRARARVAGAPAPPSLVPALRERGWDDARLDAARGALDALNHGNPWYLVLVTAWAEAIQGRGPAGADGATSEAPRGAPPELFMVDPASASPEVTALFERSGRLHFHHGPSSDYRVLAAWPDLLGLALDEVLEPVVRGPAYDATARELLVCARERVAALPAIDVAAVRVVERPTDLAALTGLLFMYQRFICDVTIDMIRVRDALG
jgi:hypothetical protein